MDLVRHIDADAARRLIVQHLVRLCADLRIAVIAEGVETPAERNALLDLGITLMQGYLFARPSQGAASTVAWAAA